MGQEKVKIQSCSFLYQTYDKHFHKNIYKMEIKLFDGLE